jgi:hypothetical protein
MSGPQMAGGMSGCVLHDGKKIDHCSVLGVPLRKDEGRLKIGWPPVPETAPRMWWFLQSGAYFSTGKDSDDANFEFGKIGMLTVDPMFAVKSKAGYHGIGVTYNFLFSGNFEPVHNFGILARPIAWQMLKFEWAVNLRFYKNGFDVIDFSDPAVLVRGDQFETILGFSISPPIFR